MPRGFILSFMLRNVLTLLLSLLLVGMQQRLAVHEVDHVRAKLERGDGVVVQNSDGGYCVECALLASGSSVVPVDDAAAAVPQSASGLTTPSVERARARPLPASYRSRAPPFSV